MPIISNDIETSTTYAFSSYGQQVVLKTGTMYSYTGSAMAFLMNVNYARMMISGDVYSSGTGIYYQSFAARIDITETGTIAATGAAILFAGDMGAAMIRNYGVLSGNSGIAAGGATAYVDVFNAGTIEAMGSGSIAVLTGTADDLVTNVGTIVGGIATGGGNDTIETYMGRVSGTLYGGGGDDTYIVGQNQVVSERYFGGDDGGRDQVISYADFILPRYVENLQLLGTARNGRGNEGDNILEGNDNGNQLNGSEGNDTVTAGSGDDILRGGAGDDLLQSLEGEDQFFGGGGDDLIVVGFDATRINGGSGVDVVALIYNETAIIADFNLATGKITGGSAAAHELTSIEGVFGSMYDDTLVGDAGANRFVGYFGNDTISGGGGNDRIEGFAGADKLDGGAGIDTVSFSYDVDGVGMSLLTGKGTGGAAAGDTYVGFENIEGGSGGDTLIGSTANNVIEGGGGADIIDGGGGHDTIHGDAGDDTLTGAGGKDIYVFDDVAPRATPLVAGGFGKDTITDFQDGADRISFVGHSGVDALADLTVAQSGANVVITVTGTTDQITLLNFSAVNLSAADFIFGA